MTTPTTPGQRLETLSPRELAALRMAADGMGNQAIAQQLQITEKGVQNLMYKVYGKLHVSNQDHPRIAAVRIFLGGQDPLIFRAASAFAIAAQNVQGARQQLEAAEAALAQARAYLEHVTPEDKQP